MGEAQLDLLARLLARLDAYAGEVTREQLERDFDLWLQVSRALELAAQCCLDLAMEIVAKRALGTPETYRDAFLRLAGASVLSDEQARALQGWAGLRNVLAHMYTSIDYDRLYAALVEDKRHLREFAAIAARELGATGGDRSD